MWKLLTPLVAVVWTLGCTSTPTDCRIAPGYTRRFAVTQLILPTSHYAFAFDFEGDRHPRNELGNILTALESLRAEPQRVVDQAIASGAQQIVVDVQSPDPTQENARGAGAAITELSGGGRAGVFCGELSSGTFTSARTPAGGAPVEMTLSLAFLSNVRVSLTAASTRFTIDGTGQVGSGQVNGAVRAADVFPLFAPPLAAYLTQKLGQEPPTGNLHLIFDYGGCDDSSGCLTSFHSGCNTTTGTPACRNPAYGSRAGMCADACDGIIDTCEVTTNAIIKAVGAPDLRLFAADGSYCPGCRDVKDAFSFGVGFTAVPQSPDLGAPEDFSTADLSASSDAGPDGGLVD